MKTEIDFIKFKVELTALRESSAKAIWLHSFDESATIFMRQILKDDFEIAEWALLQASELTLAWIEDNMAALSLFADEKPIAILGAMSIKADILLALAEAIAQSSRSVYLFSSGKNELKKSKKFIKEQHHTFVQVKAPAFWDYEKVVLSVFASRDVKVTNDAASFLVMRLGQSFYEIQNAARVCELNFPGQKEISRADVEILFKSNKHIDRFRLAGVFNQKKLAVFFEDLLLTEVDFEEMKGFFSFMITHCVKIIDTTYTQEKKSISKYDRDIITANKVWSERQLDFMIEKFSTLVISCKQKKDITKELKRLFLIFHKKNV